MGGLCCGGMAEWLRGLEFKIEWQTLWLNCNVIYFSQVNWKKTGSEICTFREEWVLEHCIRTALHVHGTISYPYWSSKGHLRRPFLQTCCLVNWSTKSYWSILWVFDVISFWASGVIILSWIPFHDNSWLWEKKKYNYSWLLITWTLTKSNLALTQTKVDFPWISFLHLL